LNVGEVENANTLERFGHRMLRTLCLPLHPAGNKG
jgi:hypothetical protein